MNIRTLWALATAGLLLAAVLAAYAGEVEPPRYFGPGVGYPDYTDNYIGSSKYFYGKYPPSKWEVYGYGTGHLGQGYGPYMYGGRDKDRTVLQQIDYGMPVIKPQVKWIGGNQVRVTAPRPEYVTGLRVDVLAFNGAVLQTATVAVAPFVIVTPLYEGSASIRVHLNLADGGFNSTVFPIVPTE